MQQHPERYHAFVGTGQTVDVRDTDRLFHADTLAWARRTARDELAATLRELGPPPYTDLLDYTTVIGYERDLNPYPGSTGTRRCPPRSGCRRTRSRTA